MELPSSVLSQASPLQEAQCYPGRMPTKFSRVMKHTRDERSPPGLRLGLKALHGSPKRVSMSLQNGLISTEVF